MDLIPSDEELANAKFEMVARFAHRLWSIWMLLEGWQPGETLDEEAKTHPAIKEYEELSRSERELICKYLQNPDLFQALIAAVDTALNLREGSSEGLSFGGRISFVVTKTGQVKDESGTTFEWRSATRESGRVHSVTIEWEDGTLEECDPTKLRLVAVNDI